nr:hypothetical protein [Tanacetum cinerariifolium]
MTHLVATLTLDSAKSYVMQGASCTQRRVFMVPFVFSISFVLSWGSSISLDSFLHSILMLVVIVVTVVIVAVILIFFVVAIVGVVIVVAIIGVVIFVMIIGVVIVVVVGGIPSIIKLSFMIIGSFSCYRSFTWASVPIGIVSICHGSSLCFQSCGNNISNQLPNGGLGHAGVIDVDFLTDESLEGEDRKQTCFLSGNNSSGTKKSQGLNSGNGNTRDGEKIACEIIGIGIAIGIKPDELIEESEDVFPGEAGK